MSRSSAIVQKKLSQLESELTKAFCLLPHSDSGQKIYRHLHKRFGYIRNLLSAEVTSTPEKTYQLRQVGEKFAALEATFRFWTYALNNYLADSPPLSDNDEVLSDGSDSPQAAVVEYVARGKKEDTGRIWGGCGKLCGAFGAGLIVGAVCCMSINSFFSFYIWEFEDVYFIHPT